MPKPQIRPKYRMYDRPERPNPPGDHQLCYSFWSMPNLINLSIMGILDEYEPFQYYLDKRFNFLLEKVGSTLQGFSYNLFSRTSTRGWIICEVRETPWGVWEFCPNLKTIRGYMTAMIQDICPPFEWSPIEIILWDFDNSQEYW
jgi:hypothetical protein